MEGLQVIEKSYMNLQKFRESILSSSFNTATQLIINLKNYDMQTQAGIKNALATVLEVYKDELDIIISKVLTGDTITIKFPKNVDGFKDDLVDSIKCYIDKRAPQLWNSISNPGGQGFYGI